MPATRIEKPAISLQKAWGELRADYAAENASRFRRVRTGIMPMGTNADWHYRVEIKYLRMLEYARDMDRNDCFVAQAIDKAVQNIVQDGITLHPATGDTGLDAELKNRWLAWGRDPDVCDAAGELNWHGIEKLALRHSFVDGDSILLGTADGTLQMVESHRLRTPNTTKKNVVHGILLGEQRQRLAYWITKQDLDPNIAVNRVADVNQYATRGADEFGPFRQVFHVYSPRRVSQTRGVTVFAPCFDLAGMFEDINFAKVVQQQIVSCFAIFHKRQAELSIGVEKPTGEQTTETLADGTTRTIEGIAPGMEIYGAPGEDLEGFSPNVPNPEFFKHVELILNIISNNLGLPLCIALMKPEGSFSAYRGAVDQARQGFKANQKWLTGRLHRPVFLWKLHQWAHEDPAIGRALATNPAMATNHTWNPPTWPYIEPNKDAQADLMQLRGCLNSPRRLHATNGNDWDDLYPEIVEDNAKAIRAAKTEAMAINDEFDDGQPVHWRDLLPMAPPEGVNVALAGTEDAADSEPEGDEPAAENRPKAAPKGRKSSQVAPAGKAARS